MPANMMFAYVVMGLLEGPDEWEMVLFFIGCFLITIGIWAILAVLIAKLLCLLRNRATRNVLLFLIVATLFTLPFLPLYGSGGHGPMYWVSAAGLSDTGVQYWLHVFPPTLLLALLHLWFRHRRIQ
ncbi:MAG: hypothetical protein KZQ58_03790 [gamma proteobacterium symbiont of Bathyaustriella thionipta]|nr:hypothetical protein [gamma proteobacterium symbiont of Bathyaustriella thionipta]